MGKKGSMERNAEVTEGDDSKLPGCFQEKGEKMRGHQVSYATLKLIPTWEGPNWKTKLTLFSV